jgi:hypothetical protein
MASQALAVSFVRRENDMKSTCKKLSIVSELSSLMMSTEGMAMALSRPAVEQKVRRCWRFRPANSRVGIDILYGAFLPTAFEPGWFSAMGERRRIRTRLYSPGDAYWRENHGTARLAVVK